jgi:hypothetical protein
MLSCSTFAVRHRVRGRGAEHVRRDAEYAGDLLGGEAALLNELGVVERRADGRVLDIARDDQDAVRSALVADPFLRPLPLGRRRVLAEFQDPGGPGGAANGVGVEVAQRVLHQFVAEAEHVRCLRHSGQAGDAVDREAADGHNVGGGEHPLRAGARAVAKADLAGVELGAGALGVQQAELSDFATLAVLAEVAGAVDQQVRHERRHEVGLRGRRCRVVEKIDELPGCDALAAVAGLAIHVQRQRGGGVGEHPDRGPHIGDRECGGRRDVRRGVRAEEWELVFGRRERTLLVATKTGEEAHEGSVLSCSLRGTLGLTAASG